MFLTHVRPALEAAPLGPEEDILKVQLDLTDDVRHFVCHVKQLMLRSMKNLFCDWERRRKVESSFTLTV